MTADEIRASFLRFFEQRGHTLVRSSPLVPEHDPTLLFANAGMNQFKDVFLGREQRAYRRATSSQKCVRAGGKHNDLENVGVTARHHTFFEMLGNFSFGDYFKREAVAYAWDYLTRELALSPARLVATVFAGEAGVPRDEEARRLWIEKLPAERVLELGAKDNFWSMGETGPCGPCSEIHYFQGDELPCPEAAAGRACLGVGCECDRWLEIWNLVFMQYDRDATGRLAPLPAPCVDTGMGLERIAAVVQGRLSNYDSDLFQPLIQAIAQRSGKAYREPPDPANRGCDCGDCSAQRAVNVSLRVVADHLRAASFLVADGVLPGNEGRGYVLRKIVRRALRHGRKLGIAGAFLGELTRLVGERMGAAYPELTAQAPAIERVLGVEEERYSSTVTVGIQNLERSVAQFLAASAGVQGRLFPGAEAFRLYDTFGLPLDLIEEELAERGLRVEAAGFERELAAQQERARQASKLGVVKGDPVFATLAEEGRTGFVGYESLDLEDARVLAVLHDGRLASRLDAGQQGLIVLDRTPFYANAGGQVGDQGVIASDGSAARVTDTTSPLPGLIVHQVSVSHGGFERGMRVNARVDGERRRGAMRHHTGTHLLHAALRETLGLHVKQAGSLVAPDRLRFDFSHYAGLQASELRQIENRVNAEILRDSAVLQKEMAREQALAEGALAFFGDKYGERVRVIEVPGFSKEFCGGTHVAQTGEIGLLLLTREQGISAGTRRVEALVGEAAMAQAQRDQGILEELESAARVDRRELVDEYAKLREQLKARERELDALKLKLATAGGRQAAAEDQQLLGDTLVWTPAFEGLDRKAHAGVVDEFRGRHQGERFLLVSLAAAEDGVSVVAAVSPSLVSLVTAPDLLRRLGLRGGGRPDFAQGGGLAAADVAPLRAKARELLGSIALGVPRA